MLRRFRFLIGVDPKAAGAAAKALPSPPEPRRARSPPLMSEAVQEIAVYIHRFHNLDLFQQGWYQIKVSMTWEDSGDAAPGIPARVVQYEAPSSGLDDIAAVWKINDADHSFCTRPFRIKFARQDVLLSVMVSFNLVVNVMERFLTSAVLLKFELLYAPMQENMSEVQNALDNFSASVHEIRVPPKALLGVHSYCPLHFDTFHTVLVDLSIHVVLLKAASAVPLQKMFSEGHLSGNFHSEFGATNNQVQSTGESGVDSKDIALWKTLCTARAILLDALENLGRAIDQRVDDLDKTEQMIIQSVTRKLDGLRTQVRSFENDKVIEKEKSRLEGSMGVSISASKQDRGSFEAKNGHRPVVSNLEMLEGFQALGSQLTSIWNAFLRFHRRYRTEIMEYLRGVWAEDRSTEWSMWLVHSKLEIPQQNSTNGDVEDDAQHLLVAGKAVLKKSNEDPVVTAASHADLHRKSIEQMKINSQYLQDLQIFGNITQVPVIYVERLIIQCQKVSSMKFLGFSGALEQAGTSIVPNTARDKLPLMVPGNEPGRSGRALRVVVFVHGFQGHHLDLRLVRNQWLLIDPGAECLMSEANEDKTASNFRELGQRLAEEVAAFLKTKFNSGSKTTQYGSFRLSFVGHSIGNIIIRTALTDAAMKPYLSNLYTFLSISGPHLGYLYSSNALFNSGLWLFKKLKGSPCMHQLTFTDEADIQNSFLFKLSQENTLENFQNIILLSSPQDRYVPYHSARIEMCQAAMRDSRKGPAYKTMLKNCLNQILLPATADRTFIRGDVNFDTSSQARTLNNFIGRAAHIEFLETDHFARFIMWSFPKLFS